MAGAFAHMCVVDALSSPRDLFAASGLTGQIIAYAIEKYQNFCELGAVGPDLPYLDFLASNSKGWANAMHYWKTADIVRAGVSYFATRNLENRDDGNLRALAWLFGYSAHVATDLTVHPVLEASGYGYAENPGGHRHCELHQDAYIFRKLKGADASDARYVENCGIGSCNDPADSDKLHPAIRALWLHCLSGIRPSEVHMVNGAAGPDSAPTPDVWFEHYTERLGEFVEQGGGFVLFFRDFLEAEAVCLPESGEVDQKYIKGLKTPTGKVTDYDAVFDAALANVSRTWQGLAQAIGARDQALLALKNANLDTGAADDDGQQVFLS